MIDIDLPVGTIRSDITVNNKPLKLEYERIKDKYYYTVGNNFEYYIKTQNMKLAEMCLDAICLIGYENLADILKIIKYVKIEDKRLPHLHDRLHKKLNYDTPAARYNLVVYNTIKRFEGFRPVNNGKITKWVKE